MSQSALLSAEFAVAASAQDLAQDGVALFAAQVLGDRFAPARRKELVEGAMPWVLSTMRSEAAAHLATAALSKAGVSHVVLKGPTLAAAWREVYGADVRTYTDVDVLVREADVERATQLLVDELQARRSARSEGECGLTLPSGAAIDLHWLLLNDAELVKRHRFDTTSLLERADRTRDLPQLADEDLLLHVCLHALVSDASKLSAVIDVAALLNARPVPPGRVLAAARRHNAVLPLAVMVDRVHALTGLPEAGALAAALPMSPWRLLCRSLLRSSAPGSGRRWSGGALLRSTRQDSLHSVSALVRSAPERMRTQVELTRHPIPTQRQVPGAPSIALISLEPWDKVWRRNQHLARELIRQHLVKSIVFVEPATVGHQASVTTPIPGITVVRPPLVVPKRTGGLQVTAQWLRQRWLTDVDILWVNDPTLGVHCLDGRPAIYDVTDDWRHADRPGRITSRLIAAEDRLAAEAFTVVCSPELARRWKSRYGVDSPVVQNAASVPSVSDVTPATLPGPGPHVGYIGTLHDERLDVDLTIALAESANVGTVHLVGPDALSGASRDRLAATEGVCLHDAVDSADVPAWMAAFDVLISPHIVTDFTLSLDAIKAFEYLSTSRPVVATPTSGFQDNAAEGLEVVPSEDFVAAVEQAIRAGHRFDRDVATWSDRAREFFELGLIAGVTTGRLA